MCLLLAGFPAQRIVDFENCRNSRQFFIR